MLRHIRTRCLIAIAGLTVSLIAPASFAQSVVNLRADAANGVANPPGLGSGWEGNAYKYLQDAISRANTLLSGLNPPDHVNIFVRGFSSGTPGYFPDERALNINCRKLRGHVGRLHEESWSTWYTTK